MMRKLLIANRGEIACRIIRTARRMGIATVAVHSDADAAALHVRMADEVVRIGPPPSGESYLKIDAIIAAAKKTGADAVHPGYGFLSESADFAEACVDAGLVFVGPPAQAVRAMGDKARAKALMRGTGVPVVPGYDGDDQSPETLIAEAGRIGFPLLVKAAAGGGGRGMRRVDRAKEVAAALEGARREAENAFGDGKLLLERLVTEARHIEVQIFADRHGNVVHLGERDCSAQRRHQKIIEETPSPFVDAAMRAAITQAAIAAARAVGYEGAGTVEFIVGADCSFFFLEMNTRLQVEHPVTEMVTGLDLVEWQLRVAVGQELPLKQDEVCFSGHAVEARLCAEDPYAGFAPQTGKVLRWRPHDVAMDGVRFDHGLVEDGEVTPFYDPMVAKVIAHGETRAEAVAKLSRALEGAPLFGLVTNGEFLLDLLESDVFAEGRMTTGYVDGLMLERRLPAHEDFASAAALLALADGDDWFSSTGSVRCPLTLRAGEQTWNCAVHFERDVLTGVEVGNVRLSRDRLDLSAPFVRDGRVLWLERTGAIFLFEEPDPFRHARATADESVVVSPVSGLLRHLAVTEGAFVRSGDVVAVVEAMKMETRLAAGRNGSVTAIRAREGTQVKAGDIVLEIAAEELPAA